jgi:hypothetical protein
MAIEKNNQESELIINDVKTTEKDMDLIIFTFKNLVASIIESEERRMRNMKKERVNVV